MQHSMLYSVVNAHVTITKKCQQNKENLINKIPTYVCHESSVRKSRSRFLEIIIPAHFMRNLKFTHVSFILKELTTQNVTEEGQNVCNNIALCFLLIFITTLSDNKKSSSSYLLSNSFLSYFVLFACSAYLHVRCW